MTKSTATGLIMLVMAMLLMFYNVADVLKDLREWHDASTPQFVAAIMKQVALVGLSALGGTYLPQPGGTALVAEEAIDPRRFTKDG